MAESSSDHRLETSVTGPGLRAGLAYAALTATGTLDFRSFHGLPFVESASVAATDPSTVPSP